MIIDEIIIEKKESDLNEIQLEINENVLIPNMKEIIITPSQEKQTKEGLFNKVVVNAINGDELVIIPTKKEQISEGVFEKVIVEPIPEEYIIPEGTIKIRENGNIDVSNYANAKVNVVPVVEPVESKGVDFVDYDGTLLYSYSIEEAQALIELPEPPTQKGLICQGWNWSLEDIKEHNRELVIGATYITDDGKTRLYIHIANDGRMDVPLAFKQSVSNGVEIDWGDGSPIETFSAKGTTDILPTHEYTKIGDYVITLNPTEDCILSLGVQNSSYCIMGKTSNSFKAYASMLRKVEIGKNVTQINAYSFANCGALEVITIPNNVTNVDRHAFQYAYSLKAIIIPNGVITISDHVFQYCYSLKIISISNSVTTINEYTFNASYSLQSITIPNSVINFGYYLFMSDYSLVTVTIPSNVTDIKTNTFSGCYTLETIIIPNGVTNIGNSACQRCYSLSKIIIPNSVINIGSSAFDDCRCMKIYDFSTHTQVPTLSNTNAFNGIPADCIILVPDELYDEWVAATNWATYADYIVKKSEVA